MNPDRHEMIRLRRPLTMASYMWQACNERLADDNIADTLHLMCPQWQVPKLGFDIDRQMAGVVADPTLSLANQGNLTERWREALESIRRSGKRFDLWATFEGKRRPDGRGYTILECQMSRSEYEYMIERVGDLFLGWEIGEWDGLYARDVVRHWTADEIPKTRREGHATFIAYIRRLHEMLYGNTNALCGMPYAHYFNELPVRMVGAETAQGLLNVQLYVSSLRGACRQYGMEFKLISSIFDRWGHTDFVTTEPTQKAQNSGQRTGPYEGHSHGLLQALWITGYLSGSSIVGHEGSFYTGEIADGTRQLSPMGEAMHRLTEWMRDPIPRGEQIRPLALMLDYYAGWAPPRHYYSSIAECVVWHCVPYGPSDYAMDRAYDCFYPGYIDSGFYRDERGFLTPTPCGDVADLLLNDASLDVMAAYPVIWLLTDEVIADECQHRLRRYVEGGGHLIVSGPPMVALASAWFGLDFDAGTREGVASFYGDTGTMMREGYFTVRKCDQWSTDWTIHARTDRNDPLIASTRLGHGEVTFVTADHGLTDKMELPEGRLKDVAPLTPHGFELLNAVKRYAREVVDRHVPVRIKGKEIYYSVNRSGPSTLLVCVYNPGWAPWEGSIELQSNASWTIREKRGPWGGDDRRCDAAIRLEGNELKVFEVTV